MQFECGQVAEELLNPLGEDDDDYDLNILIDRHLKVGLLTIHFIYARLFVYSTKI